MKPAEFNRALIYGLTVVLGFVLAAPGLHSAAAATTAKSAPGALAAACPAGLQQVEDLPRLAQIFAQAYVDHGQDVAQIMACLPSRSRISAQSLIQASAYPIYLRTLDRFRAMKTPRMQKFMAAYDQKYGADSLPILRMSDFDRGLQQMNLPAGVRRGDGQLRFSLAQIPARSWSVIFIHELQHLLDPSLKSAVMVYNSPETIRRLSYYAKQNLQMSQLNPEDRQDLLGWIEAGLGRGLWAEYRAWTGTASLYRELLQAGLCDPSEVIESMLLGRTGPGVQALMPGQIYDFLAPRFSAPPPTQAPFNLPLFREAYEFVRAQYSGSKRLPVIEFSWL